MSNASHRTTRLNKLFAPTTKAFYDVQVFHNALDFLSQNWSHQFELGKLEGRNDKNDKKAGRSFIRVHDDVYKSFLIQHSESHFYECERIFLRDLICFCRIEYGKLTR